MVTESPSATLPNSPTGDTSIDGQRPAADDRAHRRLLALLLIVDTLALALAVTIASLLRLALDDVLPGSGTTADRQIIAALCLVPVFLVLFRLQGLYTTSSSFTGTTEYSRVAHAGTYGALIAVGASYFAGNGPLVSRSWILLVWLLGIGFAVLGRFGVRRVVRYLRRRGVLHTRIVVVGASDFGVTIAEQLLRASANEGIDLVGFVDEYLPVGSPVVGDARVIARPSDLLGRHPERPADEYILVPQALPHERLEQLLRLMTSRDRPVLRIAASWREALTHGVLITERAGLPLMSVERARISGIEGALKRSLDISVSLLALVILAPAMLFALGRGYTAGARRPFSRLWIHGAGGSRLTLWLLTGDCRAGLLLRGAPALVSVLLGRLSLVGPRPSIWQTGEPTSLSLSLMSVRPGLTGPWRLSGPGATLTDQALRDLAYVRNYTVWEDLRIIRESLWRLASPRVERLLVRWQERISTTDHALRDGVPTRELAGR